MMIHRDFLDLNIAHAQKTAGVFCVLCCVVSVATVGFIGWGIYTVITWLTSIPVAF